MVSVRLIVIAMVFSAMARSGAKSFAEGREPPSFRPTVSAASDASSSDAAVKQPASKQPADAGTPPAGIAPADLEFFERKIRPVLVDQCYKCHSAEAARSNQLKGGLLVDSRAGLLKGGDSGPAVAPGNVDESLLLDALRYESFQMPPKGKLPAAVIADFQTWIERGMADPRVEAVAPIPKPGLDLEAGRRHWAYQPLQKPGIPKAPGADVNRRNSIDAFVNEKRLAHNLTPVAAADRVTLVRRLFFDLVGLPPSPEQIDEYVQDSTPEACERLVDRLLASPQFGERWGRHWLDVARFGESYTLRGFVMPDAWRYRDYVIESLNADRPFDRFIVEQIAGDLLPAESLDERQRNLVATTYLVLGNSNLEEQDKNQLRMDVVDEQIEAISKGFLAQTVGCARCHDHKFDPIPTRDYYALAGILASTKSLEHANVSKWLELPLPVEPEQEAVLKSHEAALAALQSKIADLKQSLKLASSGPAVGRPVAGVVAPGDLPGIVVDDRQAKVVGEWKLSQYTKPYIGEGYLHDLNTGKGEKTLTLLPEFPQAGQYEVRLAYTPGVNRCEAVPVTIFSADGEKTVRVNQREAPPLDGRFVSLGQYRFEMNGQGFVLISNEGTEGHVIVDAVQFLPVKVAPSDAPARSAPVAAGKTPDQAQDKISSDKQLAAKLTDEIRQLEKELKSRIDNGPKRPTYMSVVEEAKVGDTHVHVRGTVHNLGERVPRGFLQVATLGEPPVISSKQSGRKELGEWIAGRDNPLTARVMANRVWHWLFGAGLVRTPDNFGTTGEAPSHPELLNYLAVRLQEQHWSLKSLIREIVLSQTYQLSSADHAGNLAADPENRWLWRANRRRLDAECLLDALLSVSGQLNPELGGNSIRPGTSADYGYQHDSSRRAVYWPAFRNALPELFQVFDFADSSTVTGRRSVSTVAPQALFLMNDSWVIAQARHAAHRLLTGTHSGGDGLAESEPDDVACLDRAYRLAFGRLPTEAERKMALAFLGQAAGRGDAAGSASTGQSSGAGQVPGKPANSVETATLSREQRWALLFQVLFASLDFRYVD